MKMDIDEADRQMVLLSLALCSLQRPGFLYCLQSIAKQFHGGEEFEAFRVYNTEPPAPPPIPSHRIVMRRPA